MIMCESQPEPKKKSFSAARAEQYIETRAHFKAEAYNTKSIFYKRYFLTCATLMTIAAALVPVTITMPAVPKVVPTLLSLLFQAKAGVYREKDDHERKVLLVERVEGTIAKERMKTILMLTDANSPGSVVNGAKDDGAKIAGQEK